MGGRDGREGWEGGMGGRDGREGWEGGMGGRDGEREGVVRRNMSFQSRGW